MNISFQCSLTMASGMYSGPLRKLATAIVEMFFSCKIQKLKVPSEKNIVFLFFFFSLKT